MTTLPPQITISLPDGTKADYAIVASPPSPPPPPAPKLMTNPNAAQWSAIYQLGATPTVVENVILANKFETFGVAASGSGHHVRNVQGAGEYTTIQFGGASNCSIENFTHVGNPKQQMDPVFLWDLNSDITLTNLNINLTTGQHCLRIDTRDKSRVATNVTLTDSTLINTNPYLGSPLNVRAGKGITIQRVTTKGHAPGFGPLVDKLAGADDPAFFDMYLDGLKVSDCTFATDQVIQFYAGVRNFTFTNVTISTTASEVLAILAQYHNRPPSNGTFVNCTFTGPGLLLSAGSAKGTVTFTNCTFNGKPVKPDGTI